MRGALQLRALHRRISKNPPAYEFPGINRSFSRADALPLYPGEDAELKFELIATSYQFKEGHRMRIAIAGADRDHFTSVPDSPPIIEILRDKEHPSHIDLPLF